MPHHAGTEQAAPAGNVSDGDPEASANGPDSATSVRDKQLRLLFTFPVLLGLFVCSLNFLAAIRLWRSVYFSNPVMSSRANLPNTVCFTLISISFFVGLSLIAYAIALRHFDGYGEEREVAQEGAPDHAAGRVSLHVKWLVVPLLVALPAPALTVWAASTIEPIAPKPCIEVYQEALNIKKDNPNFKMVWNDRDELRCSVNQVLDQ
ncbi:hypothetical protein [Mycolicibacterium sp.]|uniref:hypothetical protein n=1 Tax=Mycolicibacterium sp. TaxID=2320850 RepID=UPI001A19999A|nr:hypothetical protein [Mycolicibacterium sp.]MBJ7339230.1 hypothetical protein [Mycolicibacterium sp.]